MVSALVRDAVAAAAVAAIAVACFVLPCYLLLFCLSLDSLALPCLALAELNGLRAGLLLLLLLFASTVKQPVHSCCSRIFQSC